MKRALDLFFIIVNVVSPLVGVLWLGWDIDEVVFLYAVEAGLMTLYHMGLYWQTARRLRQPDMKQLYSGGAMLRVLFEMLLVLGALTFLLDATVGQRTTVFDHFPVVLDYLWVTLVPVAALVAHYLPKFQLLWQKRQAETPAQHLMPLWLWTLALPLPGFVYSYLLVRQSRAVFIGLLLVVALCKIIIELVQYFGKATQPIQLQPADPAILRSSSFSAQALTSQLWLYLIILVGFFAVNPFTHDPSYSLAGNTLIYFGFALGAAVLGYQRRRVVRLNVVAARIIIESGWLRRKQRTIALNDILAVKVKRNGHKIAYLYTFTVRNQPTWRCSSGIFFIPEWQAWLQLLQTHLPAVAFPVWPKK